MSGYEIAMLSLKTFEVLLVAIAMIRHKKSDRPTQGKSLF